MTGKLTTHVLDTGRGKPAQGMRVELFHVTEAGDRKLICSNVTNSDGRINEPLLEGDALHKGIYELVFDVGAYFRAQVLYVGTPSIWEQIPIRFRLLNEQEHYHIPLLIAPGGYSTYKGS